MTKTAFRRACAGRRRMVRVHDTDVMVEISASEGWRLFERLEGRVVVHAFDDEPYAWIYAAEDLSCGRGRAA